MTRSPTLTDEGEVVRLSVVAGVGEFGRAVRELVGGQLSTLPEPLRLATALARPEEGDDFAAGLAGARHRLTRVENTNRIEESDWRLASGGGHRRVRHYVAAPASGAADLTAAVDARLDDEPGDLHVAVLRCDDPGRLADVDLTPWSSVFLLSDENRLGETLGAEDVEGAAAGAVLLSLLHPLLDRVGERTPLATFGFAGRYGLSGPAFGRLSAGMARRLVDAHDAPSHEADGSLSSRANALLEAHDPKRLGERLFDPELQRRGAPVRGGPGEEPIPAVTRWDGDTLAVDLTRGSLGLEATPPGKEDRWPTLLRRYARTWEMTRSYAWRRRLGAAAEALADEIRAALPDAFGDLLRGVPRAPSQAERVADRLDDLAARNHESERVRERDFDAALAELETALGERASPAATGARLLLWVLPALVVGVPVVRSLYEGLRGAAFPLVFGGAVFAGAVAWYLWRLQRDRERLLEARDDALAVLERRWEGLLSEAAVRSLKDEVLATLRSTLSGEVRERVEGCRTWLSELAGRLDEAAEAGLSRAVTFAPVLDRPAEYDRVLDALELGPDRHLADAVAADLLDPALELGTVDEELRAWCGRRAGEAREAAGLGFDDLWSIRMDVREDEDELGPTADRLWRFAEPLSGDARVQRGEEVELVTAPRALAAALRDRPDAERAFDADRVEDLTSVPLLACFRAVPLDVRGVEVA